MAAKTTTKVQDEDKGPAEGNLPVEVKDPEGENLPAVSDFGDMEDYAGQGLEDLGASDRSIPFIKVLEKTSPEIDTIEGAKAGMLIDTSTGELFETIRFVPACREHAFVEWVPIDNGGGLVASYAPTEPISRWAQAQRGKISLRNGNDLVETYYLFGVLLPEVGDDETEPKAVVLAFTSTRIKTYKSIVNRSDSIMLLGKNNRKFKAPWFCHVWRIGTQRKVDGNQSWYLYTAEFDSPKKDATGARIGTNDPAFQLGSILVQQKASGDLKMSQEAVAGDQPDTGTSGGDYGAGGGNGKGYGSTGSGSGKVDDEDPPF